VRVVVTVVNGDGKSCVVSDGEIEGSGADFNPKSRGWWIFKSDKSDVADWVRMIDLDHVAARPKAGSSIFRYMVMPPHAEYLKQMAEQKAQGLTGRGLHATPTVDYIFVLKGSICCDFEEGSVELHAGDALVQQATQHAWRNPGTEPAEFLAVLVDAIP
jgi:mannose-6-phosphate isomerase-like protein (cupin superfamily)